MKKRVHVKPLMLQDIAAFGRDVKRFRRALSAQPERDESGYLPESSPLNMHASPQRLRVVAAEPAGGQATAYTLEGVGARTAFFRAGQYLSVELQIGDSRVSRPYTIASSPREALGNRYMLVIKRRKEGFAGNWILDNWKTGDEIVCSAPTGRFCYEPLRDKKNIVGLASGSGAGAMLSLARAVADGSEPADLMTVIYTCRNEGDILLREQLDRLTGVCDRIRVVYVLSYGRKKLGLEFGRLDAALIEKYRPEGPCSYFVAADRESGGLILDELKKLGVPQRDIRRAETGGVRTPRGLPGYTILRARTFEMTVNTPEGPLTSPVRSDESLLSALERLGLSRGSRCRSGECGFCRSRLIAGDVYTIPDEDGRRAADLKWGFIHPCASFPLSDLTIEI